MKKSCINIYKTCRNVAGFTQEEAATLLNISIRTLAGYEADTIIPHDDIVCRMVEVYRCKQLGYLHLKYSSEVGRRYLPEITSDMARAVLKLQKEVGELSRISPDIVEIACDGITTDDKKNKWSFITQEINQLAGSALSVVFSI